MLQRKTNLLTAVKSHSYENKAGGEREENVGEPESPAQPAVVERFRETDIGYLPWYGDHVEKEVEDAHRQDVGPGGARPEPLVVYEQNQKITHTARDGLEAHEHQGGQKLQGLLILLTMQ